jgi:hypothetical protein
VQVEGCDTGALIAVSIYLSKGSFLSCRAPTHIYNNSHGTPTFTTFRTQFYQNTPPSPCPDQELFMRIDESKLLKAISDPIKRTSIIGNEEHRPPRSGLSTTKLLVGRIRGPPPKQAKSCIAADLHEREPTFTCLVLHIDQSSHSCSALVKFPGSQYPPTRLASGYAIAKLPCCRRKEMINPTGRRRPKQPYRPGEERPQRGCI